jgi:hypothetical protein
MTTLQPTVDEVGKALLTAAGRSGPTGQRDLEMLATGLLPNTPKDRAIAALQGIRDHLRRADLYEKADANLARQWFGDDCPADAMAEALRERGPVWRGEAETLALTAAMRDRTVEIEVPSWVM